MSLPVARRRAPWGPLLVVLAATGFSFKAIFIKLLYAEFPVDAETLLALRMLGRGIGSDFVEQRIILESFIVDIGDVNRRLGGHQA